MKDETLGGDRPQFSLQPSALRPDQPRLLLVDGHAYAYRAFHAIRALHAPDGAPTNAIYGFIKMLGKMQAQLAPTHQAVVWDGGLAAGRLAECPDYKAQRPPMPDDLDRQIAGLATWLDASRCPSLVRDGVEADDWIAALARQAAAEGATVVIASSDKDFMQLVTDQIGLFNPNDKTEKLWSAADVRSKTGVAPEQVVDWLSLIGDAVDNLAGVPGVGPKTASALLAQFGSVDALYARLADVKPATLQDRLRANEPVVRRNQRLIRLDDTAGAPVPLEALRVQSPDIERLRTLYEQWGFRSLRAALPAAAEVQHTLW
jgi:DNA polymerase-1